MIRVAKGDRGKYPLIRSMKTLFSRVLRPGERSVRREASSPPDDSVWNRWHRAMHYVFYGLLAFGMISALMDGPIDEPYSWRYVIAVCGLASLLGGWYWILVVTSRKCVEEYPLRALGYFVVAVALFAGLISVHPAFMSVTFIFYWSTFSLLPTRWAIPGVAVLSLLLIWSNGGFEGLTQLASVPGIAVFLGSLVVAGVLSLFIDSIIGQSEERQRLIEELEETRKELAEEERRAGVLEERGRLAREIHDTLAQGFISIVTHLEAAEEDLSGTDEASHHIGEAMRTARENLVEARRLVAALRPEILESSSLPEALARLARRCSEATGIQVEVDVTGDAFHLAQDLQVTLLRAAQEAVSNVARHAGVKEVSLTLSYADDLVLLDVADDGCGFDPDAASDDGGFGLRAMRERVEHLGGRLLIESSPGEGTTLAVQLPARTTAEAK